MMDLASVVASAKDFLSKETELHGLVNNAGIMAVEFAESVDGYESQFQTNYLSHWLLTNMLLPVLLRTAATATPGAVRVINVTSNGHSLFAPKAGIDFSDMNQVSGSPWSRYGMSKLANILHAKELHRRYGSGSDREAHQIAGNFPPATATGDIWTASVHPGSVDTNLNTQTTGISCNVQPVLKCLKVYSSPEKGSYTSLFAVASANFKSKDSGEYFVPVAKKLKPSKHASDVEMAKRLWDWTVAELGSKGLI
jgi:NAD(P)-dependent dehydrogenase (short-subunit alcohol dehydrogenase family)